MSVKPVEIKDSDAVVAIDDRRPARPVVSDGTSPPSAFGVVQDLAKLEFDAQLKLAERYDTKTRTTLGLATLVFGVAQAALTRSFGDANPDERAIVVSLAILSLLFLAVALGFALNALKSTKTMQIDGEFLHAQLANARTDNAQAHADLLSEITQVVSLRQADNKDRAGRMKISQGASIAAVAFVCIQLVVQLIVIA